MPKTPSKRRERLRRGAPVSLICLKMIRAFPPNLQDFDIRFLNRQEKILARKENMPRDTLSWSFRESAHHIRVFKSPDSPFHHYFQNPTKMSFFYSLPGLISLQRDPASKRRKSPTSARIADGEQ